MEQINPFLMYFTIACGTTVCGVLYWMIVENLAKVKYKFVLSFILSVILTPVGAWIISLVLKAWQLRKELKQLNGSAA